MLRKIMAGILVSVTVVALLAGCSTSKKPEPTNTTQPAKKEPVTLKVWSHLTQAEVDAITPFAKAWAEKTGNKVEFLFDTSDFQAFATAAQAGQGPDIMYGLPHDNLGTFQKAGLLAEVPASVFNKADYPQVAIDAVSFDGKQYAWPISTESIALIYNTAKVKTAPKTWDEFIKVAQANGFAYDVTNFYHSFGFIGGNGGYVFKNNGGALDPKNVGLASDGAKAGLKMIQDLVNTYKFMPMDITGDVAKSNFLSGKTALYLSGPWDMGDISKAGIKAAVAPMPTLPNGKPFTPFIGVYAAFVNSGSKHQAEAWELVKYMRENDPKTLFQVGTRYPAAKKWQENDYVKANAIATGFGQSSLNGIPMPNIPAMSTVWEPAKKMLEMVTQNKGTIDAAAGDAVKTINDAVAAMK
ncbi:MAG: extracellular solute-binding protein [Mycobacterium leprae]